MRWASQGVPSPTVVVTLRSPRRPLARLDEAGAGVLQAQLHVARGAEQQVALLGQDQAAGVAVEQRRLQLALQRADLPAHGRLAQAEVVAGPREAAGLRDVVEDADLVPVHGVHSRSTRRR